MLRSHKTLWKRNPSRSHLTSVHWWLSVPGSDERLQVCPPLWCQRSIAGNIEKNQVEGHIVSDQSQQHHRVPPKAVAFVQEPEHASSWWDGREQLWSSEAPQTRTRQRSGTHPGSRRRRCRSQKFRSGSWRLCQSGSWRRCRSRTRRCRRWAPALSAHRKPSSGSSSLFCLNSPASRHHCKCDCVCGCVCVVPWKIR